MAEYRPGDRVLVDISAGIVPGGHATPDWQPGTVRERLPNGRYRVRLDVPIAGRAAEKEAASEHIRPL
jgi:hypothetical protein